MAQPQGVADWAGQTHLVGRIAGRDVLACTGGRTGETVHLAVDDVAAGLACRVCRRLWASVRGQL